MHMGRIFKQKEWLEELDKTGPEKKAESKQLQVQINQNYWITDAAQKLPQ